MAFITELKNFIKFDITEINNLYNSLISNNNHSSIFVQDKIFNSIYKNSNIYNEQYQTHIISYLTYLIIRLFTPHNYEEENIDVYDVEMSTYYINKSKYYNIVKNLKDKHHDIFMTSGDVKQIIMASINFGEKQLSFNDTIIQIFNILTPEQITVLATIKDILGRDILDTIISNDPDSCLYYKPNVDQFSILKSTNVTQEHNDEINYLVSVYNYQDKIKYFHFAIDKLYYQDVGVMRDSSIIINSELLQKLLFTISSTSNVQSKFTTFCKLLSCEQLTYIGV